MALDHFLGEGGQAIPAAALRLKVQTAAESGKPEITSERRIKGREFPLRISHKQEEVNFSLSAAVSPTAPGGGPSFIDPSVSPGATSSFIGGKKPHVTVYVDTLNFHEIRWALL